MIELNFVVWEFVRLMVELEETADHGHDTGAYASWRESWQEVDARLTKLGSSDAEAFANLMMEQTVAVPCGASGQLSEAIEALTRVLGNLEQEIKLARRDPERKGELEFEHAEIGDLIDRLRGIDRSVLADS